MQGENFGAWAGRHPRMRPRTGSPPTRTLRPARHPPPAPAPRSLSGTQAHPRPGPPVRRRTRQPRRRTPVRPAPRTRPQRTGTAAREGLVAVAGAGVERPFRCGDVTEVMSGERPTDTRCPAARRSGRAGARRFPGCSRRPLCPALAVLLRPGTRAKAAPAGRAAAQELSRRFWSSRSAGTSGAPRGSATPFRRPTAVPGLRQVAPARIRAP